MIAKNYIRYPEALRFQVEMFSNGYHNSPRIMRLMEVLFEWNVAAPPWFIEQRSRAKQLVKAWKSHMVEMFEMVKMTVKKVDPRQLELVLFPAPEPKEYWLNKTTATKECMFPPKSYVASERWTPCFTTERADWSWGDGSEWLENDQGGRYHSYCRRCNGGFQGWSRIVGNKTAYSGS
nr:hypothetical protein [uncultured Rhodoferax sp.]